MPVSHSFCFGGDRLPSVFIVSLSFSQWECLLQTGVDENSHDGWVMPTRGRHLLTQFLFPADFQMFSETQQKRTSPIVELCGSLLSPLCHLGRKGI